MEVLTNIGIMKADAERLSAPEKDLCRKLERDRASLHRAGDLKRDHGMIFAGAEPEDIVLCEEDSGRWYLVEMDEDVIVGFWGAEYIEGFKAEEIEALRTKGFFYEGDACYITGRELQKAKDAWAKASDRYLADLCNIQLRLESIEAWGRFNSLRLAYEKEKRR